jgi:plastocyanin
MNRRLQLLRLAAVGAFVTLAALLPVITGAAPRESQNETETKHGSITDTIFNPQNITVGADDTVVWKNDGQQSHTVIADDGSFKSGPLAVCRRETLSLSTNLCYTGTYE